MPRKIALVFFTSFLIGCLAACNFPGVSPEATPTSAPTATLPPPTNTPTLPPPTDTPLPPTETATLPPPLPTPLAPPPTRGNPATPTVVVPTGGAKFHAVFEGGTFSFNTNSKGNAVTLKTIQLKKAVCNTGQKVTNSLTFEDVKFFPVDEGKFTMSYDRATVSGIFSHPNAASGSLWVTIIGGQCKIGPVFWTASVQ